MARLMESDAPRRFPGERAFLLMLCAGGIGFAGLLQFFFRGDAWLAPFFIGLALVGYGAAILRRVRVASAWPRVPANVLACEVEDVPLAIEGGWVFEHRPSVMYEYPGRMRRHRSRRFSVVDDGFRSPRRADIEEVTRGYVPGVVVPAHVSPQESSWSVLHPALHPRRRSHTWAAIVGGVLVMAIAIWSGGSYGF